MNTTTFIQLGRVGDILNILPAAREHFRRTGDKPFFVVAQQFASILENLPYCEGESYPGDWMDIQGAINWVLARRPLTDLRICTVCGTNYAIEKRAWNFQREAWRLSRCPTAWGTEPLELDRDLRREAAVLRELQAESHDPYGVVSLSGISSQLSEETKHLIRSRLAKDFAVAFRIIDISDYRADRIQDLQLLLSRANWIVAADSAILHLARAVPSVPVIALISDNPNPWNRSWWTPQQKYRCCYREIPDKMDTIVGVLSGELELPRIIHCWSKQEFASPETKRRINVAQLSWLKESLDADLWVEAPLHDRCLRREARSEVGDPISMPFIRDIVDHGAARAQGLDDILVLTNADVGWPSGITGAILDAVRLHGSAWTHRWDKENSQLDVAPLHEWDVADLRWYCGSDLFAFTVGWWRTIGREFPDMILGREGWDYVFRSLICRHGGEEIHRCLFHERHASFWETAANRESLPGNLHNMRLAREFMTLHSNGVTGDTFTPADLHFAL